MKMLLKNISKILYGLLMVTFFLPAIKSCTVMESRKVENSQNRITIDSTKIIDTAIDSTGYAVDTTSTKPYKPKEVQPDSAKTARDYLKLILTPDGKNDSIIGYTYRYFNKSSIAIYFFLSIISFALVLKNKNLKTLFKLSIITTALLGLFLYWGDNVVWGFWVILFLNLIILLVNSLSIIIHSKETSISAI
ncbi:hypothetical protein [Solitalea lacus]|uniref:hypothetical protein n=1 Tax=Solitalea lacus TaxID=2911172 RepID=UPI001ED9CBFE|nr:hypothetical protein [Solitalea lacus]UKJ08713.1 hypothetical protein L2B55_05970 [Solitalea lacus]